MEPKFSYIPIIKIVDLWSLTYELNEKDRRAADMTYREISGMTNESIHKTFLLTDKFQ